MYIHITSNFSFLKPFSMAAIHGAVFLVYTSKSTVMVSMIILFFLRKAFPQYFNNINVSLNIAKLELL